MILAVDMGARVRSLTTDVPNPLVPILGEHLALWGLVFKANTDDVSKSTSRLELGDLLADGATAHVPVATKAPAWIATLRLQ